MLRRMLLAASASDRVRRMAVAAPYTRDVVARYVAGDDAAAARLPSSATYSAATAVA